MSVEEAVTEGLAQPADPNAQSAEDVKNMLAELEAGSKSQDSRPKDQEKTELEAADNKEGEARESKDKPRDNDEEPDSRSSRRRDDDRRDDRRDRRGGYSGRGGRGGHRSKSFKENIKSDLTTGAVTDDPVQIRKQVEFYFSDSNLPIDKFLFEQVGGHENNPVKIEVLHSFKRMRRFQPLSAVVAALKDSTVLEVTDDDTAVRRKVPLPEDIDDRSAVKVFEDLTMPRSVYVKGFGEEVPSTQFDIEAFFAEYGPTNAIRLRRNNEKNFKGSVFVEFENEGLQRAFLSLDPQPKWKGNDLQIMSKKEYCDKKVEDIKAGKIKPNSGYDRDRRNPYQSTRNSPDYKRKRNDVDDRDWRERRAEDQKRGFRGDKDSNRRDRGGRDSRGGRGDREERGERSIPKVKDTTADDAKRDTARADAIAKARAMVDAEKKKEEAALKLENGDTEEPAEAVETVDKVEENDQEDKSADQDTANKIAQSVQEDVEVVAGKKRAREDDEGDVERESKKATVKAEGVEEEES